MSGTGGGAEGAGTGPRPYACLPSAAQLVGVWAKAMGQLWDIGLEWWKVGVEQGFVEDRRLGVWSTTLLYPRPEAGTVTLRCTRFESAAGEQVPLADVVLDPEEVSADGGPDREVRVVVNRPLRHTTNLYTFAITETPGPAPAAATAPGPGAGAEGAAPQGVTRTFSRAFGVPDS